MPGAVERHKVLHLLPRASKYDIVIEQYFRRTNRFRGNLQFRFHRSTSGPYYFLVDPLDRFRCFYHCGGPEKKEEKKTV